MLEHLFSSFNLKGKNIKNRCVVPAMVTNYCNEDGTVTETFMAYHEAKARGGFGMIITEDFAVTPEGKGFPRVPGLWNDEQLNGFSEFTRRVHAYDTVLIAQIYHAGRQTSKAVTGHAPCAPSAIPCPFSPDMPHELTLDEIQRIVSQFGDCARRAEVAGFDGIEIHGGHGYLIAQFLSPYSNKRTDAYGGCLQNRMRFALDVIADIHKKCSKDFILGFRISVDEFVTGGRTLADTKAIIPFLEAAGIDYLHATAGVYRSFDTVIPSMYCRNAWLADSAGEIKKCTALPVIAVGRIQDPCIANSVIASGQADLVAMGRQSLCDPETPNKAKEGRFASIRPCIGCHHGCVGNLLQGKPIRCIFNPSLGLEVELRPVHTVTARSVMVVGAGPAGLQAAISAAKCGHRVTVHEQKHWAGGQFRLGAVPPAKGEIIRFINWQLHQLEELGVSVRFDSTVTPELVEQENPDIVIIAAGAVPVVPPIPGVDNACVVTAHAVLEGSVNTGSRIVVIGGGCVGAEAANYLASNLKSVTIIEMRDDIALDEAIVPRWGLVSDLQKNQVRVLKSSKVKKIVKEGVIVDCNGAEEFIPADTVVLATGARSRTELMQQLDSTNRKMYVIGDGAKVGLAGDAITQGFYLGRSLSE